MAFENKRLTRQIGLLHKLIKSDLDSCDSMNSYVNLVISTANQLNAIGFKMPDLWVGMILLASLPEKYRPMILAMENSVVLGNHRRLCEDKTSSREAVTT